MLNPDDAAVYALPIERQLPIFIDDHREALLHLLDGLTEEEARRRLVPSRTTLLGLIKHATFVERVWFDETVTGRSRKELGLAADAHASFALGPADTIETVVGEYRSAVDQARAAVAGLPLDALLPGNRRGPLPLRWVYLHVLRELAQHCGHGEILREQVIAARSSRDSSTA